MTLTPSDRFAIFVPGTAGSSISRALKSSGYEQQFRPTRQELDLLDPLAVQQWFTEHQPTVVVLAAAKVEASTPTTPIRLILLENQNPDSRDRKCLACWGAAPAVFGQ